MRLTGAILRASPTDFLLVMETAMGLLELLRYADASEGWAVAAQEAAKVPPLKRSSGLDTFQNCIEAFKPKEKKLK